MVSTAAKAIKGARPTQFIDKLGERLAFERTGVRLYEALISKYNTHGGFTGGPTLAKLEENMLEEHSHFLALTEVLTRLGADPTVIRATLRTLSRQGASPNRRCLQSSRKAFPGQSAETKLRCADGSAALRVHADHLTPLALHRALRIEAA